jgi:dipeptidyl aminopeptidase/acylaminoacyl peptidase
MIGISDFTEIKSVSGLKYSPDGERIAFVVQKPDIATNAYLSNLWLWERAAGSCRELAAEGKDLKFIWIDPETILYQGIPDESHARLIEQGENWTFFYALNVVTGERKEHFRIPLSVKRIEKTDDGTYILTAGWNGGLPDLGAMAEGSAARQQAIRDIAESRDYEIIEELPVWSNGTALSLLRQRQARADHG